MDDDVEVFADDVGDEAEVSDAGGSEEGFAEGVEDGQPSESELLPALDSIQDDEEHEANEPQRGPFGGHNWIGGNPFLDSSRVPSTLAGVRDVYLPTHAQNQQTAKDYRAGLNDDSTKVVKK
jgi:hypothetical protein